MENDLSHDRTENVTPVEMEILEILKSLGATSAPPLSIDSEDKAKTVALDTLEVIISSPRDSFLKRHFPTKLVAVTFIHIVVVLNDYL